MKESHLRSLLKGISWRVFATLTTVTISYIIIGEPIKALSIGGLELVSKFILYYAHERGWQHINLGMK